MAEPLEGYHPATHWPTEPDGRPPPRCHWCGYELYGLTRVGKCPECGQDYTPESATRLKPWPSAGQILFSVTWPLIGVLIFGTFAAASDGWGGLFYALIGYLFLLMLPLNVYFRVRALLKEHMPERERTRGVVAALRAHGTVLAWTLIVLLALSILAPVVLFAACLLQ